MDESASGIILRVRPLTETSLIVNWLTMEEGRISTVAKGARRPKSSFIGKLDLFYEADFSFQRSRRSELHLLKEVSLRETHARLRESLPLLNSAAYFAVLIEQGTERETPLADYYGLLRWGLSALLATSSHRRVIFAFELRFLQLAGFEPDLSGSRLPKESRELARGLAGADWNELRAMGSKDPAVRGVEALLRNAIGTALEKIPPQRERALQARSFPKTTEPSEERG